MTSGVRDTGERLVTDRPTSVVDQLVFARHVFAYLTVLDRTPGARRLLDLGCGIGYGTKLLAGTIDEVTGVEVALEPLVSATEDSDGRTNRFVLYDGSTLPFRERTFDTVTSFQAIEHVEDDAGFVGEISRVLRPEGVCVLSTPNAETRLKPGEKPWWRFHVREYRREELKLLLERRFRTVSVFGVVATREAMELERRRIEMARRLAAIDPFDLRRLVPTSLARAVTKLLVLGRGRPANPPQFRPEDFHLSESTESAIDLMAFCRDPVQSPPDISS